MKTLKNQTTEEKLKKIAEKYNAINYNEENYYVGGGLDNCKFASRRHEDACNDKGKLTLGKCNALFAKATELTVDEIKEIILFAFPNLEWHHAGKLPKQYGGGMKKTYFVNAKEIIELAENFENFKSALTLQKTEKLQKEIEAKNLSMLKEQWLVENAKKVVRVSVRPDYFIEIDKEMNGKHGWFSSYGKYYNLPEYYTGWSFSFEKYTEYYSLFKN
jgi:hypothetical protein